MSTRLTMADAKEWAKVAENIVKIRNWLYKMLYDDTITKNNETKILQIRYLLMLALTEIEVLAQIDDEGWL